MKIRSRPLRYWRVAIGFSILTAIFGLTSTAGHPRDIPLPPPRPADLTPPSPPLKEPPQTAPVAADDSESFRTQVLASRHIVGEGLAPIADKGGCGIAAPVRLDAIILSDGAKVIISQPVILRATLAAAIADWVRDDLAPALANKNDRLTRIEGTGGYECRGRNRVAGAKLSEHAIGNALDLQSFVTERGKHLSIAAAKSAEADAQTFMALVKKTACIRFMTVLGPGSDPFHAQHLHVDLEARRHGAHFCQWNVQDVAEAAPVKR